MSVFDQALKQVAAQREEERQLDPGAEGRRRLEAYLRLGQETCNWNQLINQRR